MIGRKKKGAEGVALIEAALVMPMLALLMLNVANFGIYIYDWIVVDNAARAALEYRVYAGVVLGLPPRPTFDDLDKLVKAEVYSIRPNRDSVTWEICKSPGGETPCQGTGEPFTPPGDPDPGYALYAAKVCYPYDPLFSAALTLPLPHDVCREVRMRSME